MIGEDGGMGNEAGLGRTGGISTETLGVTGVGLIVLGAMNDLFWEGEGGGGSLKATL